ncbi:MAG: glycosyltransferase [Chloroflexi bacterium]|nr:glycosyltransferase [Chloroflexota bacterium]
MTRFAFFYHSLISDWNHGNAHFLRGIMRALQARGHAVICYEERDNWSLHNLLDIAPEAISDFTSRFPDLAFDRFVLDDDLDPWLRARLTDADVCVVHEWNPPQVVRRCAELCADMGKQAYFHDTHYRVVLDDAYRTSLGLEAFTGILAYSPSLAERYQALGFERVRVLHEAADVTVFSPLGLPKMTDVVFVGNYGDGDRSDELEDFVFDIRPALPDLTFAVYGVRYPAEIVSRLTGALRIDYRGWMPNALVPSIYSAASVVLHIPRRQYVELLPGTPTIRMFEALACGACLISLPWDDTDHLFEAGADYAVAHSPTEMRDLIAELCSNETARNVIGEHGRRTILEHHTCGHRAEQLLEIVNAPRLSLA